MTAPVPVGYRSARRSGALSAPSLALLLPIVALAAAGFATARFQIEPGARAATAALTLIAAATLAPLALLRPARTVMPIAALLAGVALVALPHWGVLRLAVVLPLLLAATAAVAGRALDPEAGAPTPTAAIAVALAAQLATRGDRLWLEPTAPGAWLEVLFLPPLVGLALASAGTRGGAAAARATALALLLFAGAGAWQPVAAVALALFALVERFPRLGGRARTAIAASPRAAPPLLLAGEPAWLALARAASPPPSSRWSPRRSARAPGRCALVVALAAGCASALPWRRPAPLASALGALVSVRPAAVARPIETRPVVLTAAAPRFEATLPEGEVGGWVVDSYLVRSTGLGCGRTLATVRFDATAAGELEIGRDSAEWAAERRDVAPTLACPAPPAWSSWFPGEGRFLGHHFRGRGRLAAPIAARRVVVERDPTLPPETAVAIFHLAVER
ncbi:MAG: hypothetical protein H6511_05955 [Holophagales bacterium]|nr:hypothetical protein [Holophagales bacterium]